MHECSRYKTHGITLAEYIVCNNPNHKHYAGSNPEWTIYLGSQQMLFQSKIIEIAIVQYLPAVSTHL